VGKHLPATLVAIVVACASLEAQTVGILPYVVADSVGAVIGEREAKRLGEDMDFVVGSLMEVLFDSGAIVTDSRPLVTARDDPKRAAAAIEDAKACGVDVLVTLFGSFRMFEDGSSSLTAVEYEVIFVRQGVEAVSGLVDIDSIPGLAYSERRLRLEAVGMEIGKRVANALGYPI
jgi:hypothetical protein